MGSSRRFLHQPPFLFASLLGSLTSGVALVVAPLEVQIAILGVIISILAGLVLTSIEQHARREASRAELDVVGRVIEAVSDDRELAGVYRHVSQAFLSLIEQTDPILRSAAVTKLLGIANQLGEMARGVIMFHETESWRTAYEELLLWPDLKGYRSVAWVKCPSYWQDAPGRQSLRANYEAIQRGVVIQRIIVLPAELWPSGQLLPSETILPWILDQRSHGVQTLLCLESEIDHEAGLPLDFGVYGDRAVGTQTLDEHCRTQEFRLEFGAEAVKLAEERWRLLKLHATPLENLLDDDEGTA